MSASNINITFPLALFINNAETAYKVAAMCGEKVKKEQLYVAIEEYRGEVGFLFSKKPNPEPLYKMMKKVSKVSAAGCQLSFDKETEVISISIPGEMLMEFNDIILEAAPVFVAIATAVKGVMMLFSSSMSGIEKKAKAFVSKWTKPLAVEKTAETTDATASEEQQPVAPGSAE
jgi:hypothetical protein